jgi:short-subunit dehydrogenase
MHGFLEAVRIENMHNGLHVLIAAPGFTASNIRKSALVAGGTEQGESPRTEEKMMPADEVARHIYKAITRRKKLSCSDHHMENNFVLKKLHSWPAGKNDIQSFCE